jgi:hypothetical protein
MIVMKLKRPMAVVAFPSLRECSQPLIDKLERRLSVPKNRERVVTQRARTSSLALIVTNEGALGCREVIIMVTVITFTAKSPAAAAAVPRAQPMILPSRLIVRRVPKNVIENPPRNAAIAAS